MSPHPSTEQWDPAGEEVRRAVLGDAHVDRAVANTDAVTADFQFDVPVRFDTDSMAATLENVSLSDWQNLPIIEIKV